MRQLELQNITIQYGETTIICDLSLSVENGEIVSLLGPSGAGKTTILKTIAGLLQPHIAVRFKMSFLRNQRERVGEILLPCLFHKFAPSPGFVFE